MPGVPGPAGALPVPNKRAIESIVKAGLATNCEIRRHSMFYRKHYFYPDMAKNFQTTQGPVAFAMYGHLDLDVTGRGAAERPDCAFGEAEAQSLAERFGQRRGPVHVHDVDHARGQPTRRPPGQL